MSYDPNTPNSEDDEPTLVLEMGNKSELASSTKEYTEGPPSPPRGGTVIAVANQKGGVGKTTTVINIGAWVASMGYRVLAVDLDPQANLTTGVGVKASDLAGSTSYEAITGAKDPRTIAVDVPGVGGMRLIAACGDLAGAQIELVAEIARETKLRQALDWVRNDHHITLIDCPPSLGLLTVNALTAADAVLIPIQCEYFALEGLSQLLEYVSLVRRSLNKSLSVIGMLLTMADARTRLSAEVAREVREHFGDLVFQTVIPRSVRLAEASSYGEPIAIFDPSSRGAAAYRAAAEELVARVWGTAGIDLGGTSPQREVGHTGAR